MKKKPLIVIAVCVGLWVVGSVVTPVLKKYDDGFPDVFNDHVLHERVKAFPTAHSAPKSGKGEAIFVLPGWVPEDAKDVEVKGQTTGNAKLIRFTLARAPLKLRDDAACRKHAFNLGPTLAASWWPQDVGDGAGRPVCSGMYEFRVAAKGDHVYAWSNGNLSPG